MAMVTPVTGSFHSSIRRRMYEGVGVIEARDGKWWCYVVSRQVRLMYGENFGAFQACRYSLILTLKYVFPFNISLTSNNFISSKLNQFKI